MVFLNYTIARGFLPVDHPITQADSLYVLIGPVRVRTPYPLLTRGWQGEALTGVGRTKPTARRSLSQPTADSSLYAREPAPLPPAGIPCPLLLGEGGPAGPGVEGTPTGPGRTGIKSPPPGGSLPLRGRWPGHSPGRMRGNNRKVKNKPR